MLRARIKNSIRSFQKVGGKPPFLFGNALRFDGTDDYVSTEVNKTVMTSNGSNFTISFWYKKTSTNVFGVYEISNTPISGVPWILCQNTSSGLRYYLNGNYRITETFSNGWNHFVLTYDNSTWKSYVNGVLNGSYVGNVGTNSGNNLYLGSGFGGYLNGVLDEMAIWNTELNSTQISNLWANGDGDYATNYSPANLLAYWRMNGTSGDTTAIDEQGTYNGTLTNFNTSTCWVAH